MIPQISYTDLKHGLSEEQEAQIRTTGVVVVKGAVPKEVYYISILSCLRYLTHLIGSPRLEARYSGVR